METVEKQTSSHKSHLSKTWNIFPMPPVSQGMSIIKYIFTPNYVKYEGVRPINIYLLRVL